MTKKLKVSPPIDNFRIILDGIPPSVNLLYGYRCYKNIPTKYKTARGKEYITETQKIFKQLYPTHKTPFENNCSVIIRAYFGDKRKHDIDNVVKTIFDSFNGLVYKDDNQIQKLVVEKGYCKGKPRTEIIIEKHN